jgi:hypothetical protein
MSVNKVTCREKSVKCMKTKEGTDHLEELQQILKIRKTKGSPMQRV